jgi:hypothetical protein
MERSSLRFNEAAKKAFTTLKLAPGQPHTLQPEPWPQPQP